MIKKRQIEVLGIGTPVVDQIIKVEESFLDDIIGEKGGMVVVDFDTIAKIIRKSPFSPIILPGGSSANTIRGLAQLGHQCALIGKIGRDPISRHFLESLSALKIQSHLIHSSTPTAQVLCLVTPDGERTMRAFLGAGKELRPEDLQPSLFENVSLVHIEGYTLLTNSLTQRAMELAKEAGAKVSFDLGSFEVVKQFKDTIIKLLPRYVDIVFGNKVEIEELTNLSPEKACKVLKDLCETSVVLLGSEGCIVGSGIQQIRLPALSVQVVDTTGAGDLFLAGFLHGYLRRRPLEDCAHFGTLAGGAAVQVSGVDLPIEAWSSIKETIAKHTKRA